MLTRITLLVGLAQVCWFVPLNVHGAQTEQSSDFKQVYDLIKANLEGISDADLNAAAIRGITSALNPRVILFPQDRSLDAASGAVTRSNIFETSIAYVRVAKVASGLETQIRSIHRQFAATNKIAGVVLDLRFGSGDDYEAAAAAADLFQHSKRPLLNLGKGYLESSAKENAITVPVAVLVNGQTAGAAEALAAILRQTGVALLLGSRTAGQAMVARDFNLAGGQRLRIATGKVHLGDGASLDFSGVKPDIEVEVPAADEQQYYADAFKILGPSNNENSGPRAVGGSSARRLRQTEADLVRERREGSAADADGPRPRKPETDAPIINDPALARALDLLKGLAVVRKERA